MKLNLKRKIKNITQRDVLGLGLLFVLAVVMLAGLGWGFEGVFFWLFFASLFYWKVDSRVSIGLALAGLVGIMLMLALSGWGWAPSWQWGGQIITMHFDALAEKVAVWVYFFLVIGVVKQIYEFKTGGFDNKEDEKNN